MCRKVAQHRFMSQAQSRWILCKYWHASTLPKWLLWTLAQPQKADEESCASIAMPSGFTKTGANGQRSVDGKIKRDLWVLEEFCRLSWSKTLSFHLSLWLPSLWIFSQAQKLLPIHVDMSWHRSYFGQIMIVLMCHGIILYPCWLHVCQGSKLKYTCQHIDTGSGVGRWPSTGLCHRPRVGEYCASIGMPLPFRSGYYGGRFSCSIFWRSCNPLRFCALFVPCPQAEDSLHEY